VDQLDFLIRRYRQILPRPLTVCNAVTARELQCWLRDDVAGWLGEFVQRASFREQARWPIRTLGRGANTPARAEVEAVDAVLVACACALQALGKKATVRERLQALAVDTVVAKEEVLLGDGPPRVLRRDTESVDRLPLLLSQIDWIAERSWNDLVCVEDYFEPAGGWAEQTRPPKQPGEFVVALNPELHPGGDFVSRCLCQRVEGLRDILGDARGLWLKASNAPGVQAGPGWEEAEQHWQALKEQSEQLRRTCLQSVQQPLRDACVLLTQVYAALRPRADLSWLGLSDRAIQRGAVVMGHRLLQACQGELLERLAASLGELRRRYPNDEDGQDARERAIAAGGLVLIGQPPQAYWEGKLIPVEWTRYPALWRFLSQLAEKGRRGSLVEAKHLYGDGSAPSALGTVFGRLKKKVPVSLWRLITPGAPKQTYELKLDRDRIHLF
jgi:hypothetical protein